jgi:putative IMPACT (imprinted ancient) family translation regulator
MLRVLEGADLTDCLAVCIRWFGGTKLGTGGLVRAYTESLQGALEEARVQGLLEDVRVLRGGEIRTTPALAHLPYAVLGAFAGVELGEQAYEGGEAVLRFRLPPGREGDLEKAWNERSRGGRITWS